MKKKDTILLVLFVAMLTMLSCQKAKNEFPSPEEEPHFLSVKDKVQFPNTGSTQTIDIATNSSDWVASSNSDWVKLTRIDGAPGKLSVEVAPNTIMDERSATVSVSINGTELATEVAINQFGTAKIIKITQGSRITINGTMGMTPVIEVITNCPEIEWEITSDSPWLTDLSTKTKSTFDEWTKVLLFQAEQNNGETSREATIAIRGVGLGLGASATLIISQSANVEMEPIPASLISYTGVSSNMGNLFDGLFTTFGETGYGADQGGEFTNLDIKVNASALYKILYYPRGYSSPTALGSTHQYPTDMELWADQGSGWVKISDVAIRGTGAEVTTKHYPRLVASQVPYPIYDGAPITGIKAVRLVIKSGNSKTGENNQFWNGSEIRFEGTPSTVIDPIQVTITNSSYSWQSGPAGDGDIVSSLHDGNKTTYWQSSYSADVDFSPEFPWADALKYGTSLTLDLDKTYNNFTGLRYYPRNASQVPVKFDILVDPGNGIYTKVKSFEMPAPWSTPLQSIELDEPVKARSLKIHVTEAAGATKLHFCAFEIEAYALP